MSADAQTGRDKRDDILAKAVHPADGYGGDVSERDAWALLEADQGTQLVDVRTRAEWSFVGLPDLSGLSRELGLIEWVSFPDMAANISFQDQLNKFLKAQGAAEDDVIMFLCRSGQRSIGAARAATAMGYKHALNVLGGFEGNPDEQGHRGKVNGWKVEGLPWKQG